MEIDADERRLTLSVGELARMISNGNLSANTPSLSLRGKLGGAAHRAYQEERRKSSAYRQEVHLNVSFKQPIANSDPWEIRVRGRLDGLIEEIDRTVVEEIKSVALPRSRFSVFSPSDYPRHRRQIEIYLHLLSAACPEKSYTGKLIYINLPDGKKRSFVVTYSSKEIEPVLEAVLADLIERAIRRTHEKHLKKATAAQITFPFSETRSGQEEIITAIMGSLEKGRNLILEAPTGLGKTAASLYAVLRYTLENDKQVMFLTSKTTQQALVFETAALLKAGRPFPRVLLLSARSKLCPLAAPRCNPDECVYIEEFSHKLRRNSRVRHLLDVGLIHPDHLAEVGARDLLCPAELQLALSEEADLIIGDYNYAFDPGCRLASLFEDRDTSRLILVVDEAHNLPERARSYYSAKLTWSDVLRAVETLREKGMVTFDPSLTSIQSQFEYYLAEAPKSPDPYPVQLSLPAWEKIATEFEKAVIPYWYGLTSGEEDGKDDPILALQRTLEHFLQSLKFEGENFVHLVRRKDEPALEVLCLDAAPFLKETFDSVHTGICMSATLQPFEASGHLLGLGTGTDLLALPNPFPQEHCRLLIDTSVTTLYRERDNNVQSIASLIERYHGLLLRRTLAFFPSFESMRRIAAGLRIKPLFLHREGMSDAERSDLLRSFGRCRRGLLCTVMGGVFAEGIDLPGDLAEAAVIVGVGLPQVCTENDLIRAYYDRRGDNGFEFAYLYPGMRRVIQSVGRVIRSETDRGVILLLDRRYGDANYQRFFPRHWYKDWPSELICEEWEDTVREFASNLSVES